jgi:hypothetical protein
VWNLVLILREEHGLSVFEKYALRRIFGSKGDGVTGRWRKLHNEELHDLSCSSSIIRIIKSSSCFFVSKRLLVTATVPIFIYTQLNNYSVYSV